MFKPRLQIFFFPCFCTLEFLILFLNIFFGVPHLATCIFLFFYNEPELGVEIDPGMALYSQLYQKIQLKVGPNFYTLHSSAGISSMKVLAQKSCPKHDGEIYLRCQFHQHFKRKFLVRKSFRQLFSCSM